MDVQEKNQIVKALNKGLKEKVTEIVNRELGLQSEFDVFYGECGLSSWYVCFGERNNSSKEAITANPLLRQMFKDSKIFINVGLKESTFFFMVDISCDHNFCRGSNSVELMKLSVEWKSKDDYSYNIKK